MYADTLYTLEFESLTNLQSGIGATACSESHLHSNGNISGFDACPYHPNDLVRVAQEGRSRIVAANFGRGAAEVEINYVGAILQQLDCGDHFVDVSAEYLRDERALSRIALDLEP